MKSFGDFLLENIKDLEKSISDFGCDETFIHVDDNGEVVVENKNTDSELIGNNNEDGFQEEDFDMFYSDDN